MLTIALGPLPSLSSATFANPCPADPASRGVEAAEIEEIVQEAFLRLHRHLLSARSADRQNLKGWMFRVAQNLVRDRRRGWHGRHVDSIEDRPEATLASAPGATPEERVLHLEQASHLCTAWQALPDRQRRCLACAPKGCVTAKSPKCSASV